MGSINKGKRGKRVRRSLLVFDSAAWPRTHLSFIRHVWQMLRVPFFRSLWFIAAAANESRFHARQALQGPIYLI
jgi:hypothetical protein